jgi:hypothetical protein
VFQVQGRDGVLRTLVQSPGELNNIGGRFEWMFDGWQPDPPDVRQGRLDQWDADHAMSHELVKFEIPAEFGFDNPIWPRRDGLIWAHPLA